MARSAAFALAVSFASAATAQQACPDGEDLAAGVRFQMASGESETFRRLENGLIEAHYQSEPGRTVRSLLAKGIYLLEIADYSNGRPIAGTRTTYSFPIPPEAMPGPAPGGGWTVVAGKLDRGEFGSEIQTYSFDAPVKRTYGACIYDIIPIGIAYPSDPDSSRRDILHYLPELGLAYLAGYHDENGSASYSYTGIEALK